jgi:hypothetical protein
MFINNTRLAWNFVSELRIIQMSRKGGTAV